MVSVKIIQAKNGFEYLQEKINSFIQENDIDVRDIKFKIDRVEVDNHVYTDYYAIIIYK